MKRLLYLISVLVSLWSVAQENQYFLYNGKVMYGTFISQSDSITFGNSQSVDTLHLLLPRTVVKTETIHDTIYVNRCPEDNETNAEQGKLQGLFSVSKDKKIRFSQGNLQYRASTDTWRFADRQYDIIGIANNNISPTYDGWIDLFGWGTGDNPTNTSGSYSDYSNFVDWGVNAISNGGNTPNMWRTLSGAEWEYLLIGRENAENLFALGHVEGVSGIILLPDGCVLPKDVRYVSMRECGFSELDITGDVIGYIKYDGSGYDCNYYSYGQWEYMESFGAVFLPAAGMRIERETSDIGESNAYWSSSLYTLEELSYHLWSVSDYVEPRRQGLRYRGYSVRLVFDVIGELPGEFSVGENTKVQFSKGNLQYQASTNTWRFAENQYEVKGVQNRHIGPKYAGWIDLFGWGTGNHPTDTSRNDDDYLKYTEWGINPISNGGNKPNQWRTLNNDEWYYLGWERPNAENLIGFGLIRINKYDSIPGLILLPDNWNRFDTTIPIVIPAAICGYEKIPAPIDGYYYQRHVVRDNTYCNNEYTLDQWKELETAGAVFLPMGLDRLGAHVSGADSGWRSRYWSSSPPNSYKEAYGMDFRFECIYAKNYFNHILPYPHVGYSVRLVRVK